MPVPPLEFVVVETTGRSKPLNEDAIVSTVPGEAPRAAIGGATFFGHPRALATLFFTEMWERFSYYGMRAILVLFMTASAAVGNPGLGFNDMKAGAVYGLYTAMVWLAALPGGWVGDKLWGTRKATFVGGCIIAAGHFTLAIPTVGTFYLGLCLVVVGTGLLKPNISAIVGDLYPEGGARRDAGYSVYYMGINLGAFLGPLFCGFLGEGYNWHLGFSLAGIGMLAGLVQYRLGLGHLGSAGLFEPDVGPEALGSRARRFYGMAVGTAGALLLFVALSRAGILDVTLTGVAQSLGVGIVGIAALFFLYVFTLGGHTREEKKRLLVIVWIVVLAAVFWSGFEQAGSSMNLFAERLTDRVVFGWEAPASWLQSVNPIFIILLAPLFGTLWTWLERRNANPSIPLKFALGLLGLAAGFFVLAWGAAQATGENAVTPAWLIVTYFLHTCGELALSPVGLSSITKLSPKGRVSQMMGIWFIASALGNLIAGLVAGRLETMAPGDLFRSVALIAGAVGVLALLVSPLVNKLTGRMK